MYVVEQARARKHFDWERWVSETIFESGADLTRNKYGNYQAELPEKSIHTNSVAFSPQANYTDWATATCWRNLVLTFADRGVSRGQRGVSPTVVNLSFLDRSRYFPFK
jgi:hypothetical protein